MNNFFHRKNVTALIFGLGIGLIFSIVSLKPLIGLIIALVFFLGFKQRRRLT